MIPRIKSIIDRNEYKLEVLFDDGKCVLYDVKEDINQIPSFKDFELELLVNCWTFSAMFMSLSFFCNYIQLNMYRFKVK